MVRKLSARGHIIDEFMIRGSVANGDYLPLKPFVRASSEIIIQRPHLSWLRPFLLGSYAQLGVTLYMAHKAKQAYETLANAINAASYDFVHIDQFTACRAIGILPYLRRPNIVYIHEGSGI